MSLVRELKRRNVFRVGIAYALIAWVVLQIVDFLTQLIGAPTWVLQVFFIAAAIGLFIVLIFSWVYEMTPEGLKKESEIDRAESITPQTGRKLDRIIIVFLAVAVAFLLAERYWHPPAQPTEVVAGAETEKTPAPAATETAVAGREKSVAVLPFVALSNGPDDEFFADGLTEEILNSLAQLPELLVTARSSAFAFKGEDESVEEIGRELGVRHIVEGSVRRAGDRLRVTAQLVRVADGFHLWSETYDRDSADVLEVQEDIAEQIATALDVVLDADRREAMRQAGLRDPRAFIAWQKARQAYVEGHGAVDQIQALLAASELYDDVLERAPGYPPALLEHADAYVHILNDSATGEYTLGSVPQETIDRAYEIATSDFAEAAENARNLDERNAIQLDLAILTGNFLGIRNRIEAYLDGDDCVHPNWADPVATVFGYAAQVQRRLESVVACDPLSAPVRFARARAALWAGDAEEAIRLEEESSERLSHPWLDAVSIWSLTRLGRYESAANEIERRVRDPFFLYLHSARLAAARGDEAQARQFAAQMQQAVASPFAALQHHAILGDRAQANELAAKVDSRAYGPLPLILITLWCSCGAPFDLEATPNFAAKIAEGNLPWPPPDVMNYPLKDW